MDNNAVLSKEDIDIIIEKLGLEPEYDEHDFEQYYNFWDFGKSPDDTQSVVEINANLSLLTI